jgi:hypothetical protein
VVWGSADGGVVSEFVEELSTRSVRESFFMFRRDRGFVVGRREWIELVSDAGDEATEVEVELPPGERTICGISTGASIRRAVGGPFLRGIWVVDVIMFRRLRIRMKFW